MEPPWPESHGVEVLTRSQIVAADACVCLSSESAAWCGHLGLCIPSLQYSLLCCLGGLPHLHSYLPPLPSPFLPHWHPLSILRSPSPPPPPLPLQCSVSFSSPCDAAPPPLPCSAVGGGSRGGRVLGSVWTHPIPSCAPPPSSPPPRRWGRGGSGPGGSAVYRQGVGIAEDSAGRPCACHCISLIVSVSLCVALCDRPP